VNYHNLELIFLQPRQQTMQLLRATHQVLRFSSVAQTFTGAAALAEFAPLSVVGSLSHPGTGSLNVTGQTPETATTYTPGTGSINVQGHAQFS
jgi:hypothetical protein